MNKVFNIEVPIAPMVADLRGECCAVYLESRKDDSEGLNPDQERIIFYSSKGAKFNGSHWDMGREDQELARAIAAIPEMYEVVNAARGVVDMFKEYGKCGDYIEGIGILQIKLDNLDEKHRMCGGR